MAEIVASLSKDGIGQATVHRAVALLEKRNLIGCVHGSDGEHRYVCDGPPGMCTLWCVVPAAGRNRSRPVAWTCLKSPPPRPAMSSRDIISKCTVFAPSAPCGEERSVAGGEEGAAGGGPERSPKAGTTHREIPRESVLRDRFRRGKERVSPVTGEASARQSKTKAFYVGEGACGVPESVFPGRKRYVPDRVLRERRGCFLYAREYAV